MIPPVEERAVRPCWTEDDVCVCFHDEHIDCHLEEDVTEDPNLRQKDPKNHPCKYNMYTKEYRELIDSGAANLRALQYVPPDLNDYDGTIRFKDVGKDTEVICMDDTVLYMLDPEYDHGNEGAV